MMLAALAMMCVRCDIPKNIHWEEAIKHGAKRAKEKDIHPIRAIVLRESGNAPSRHKQNRTSTAYGYGQFLNQTWKGVGIKKTDCGVCQIEAMIYYCRYRYGSPAKALASWNRKKWY